jgi:hypothetical protein
MPPEKLFVRDPREVQFLKDQVRKVLALADKSANDIPVREDDDFGFMTTQFLYKQIQHAQSVLALVPRRDAGLVARTMIEGLVSASVDLSGGRRARQDLALLRHYPRLASDSGPPQGGMKK